MPGGEKRTSTDVGKIGLMTDSGAKMCETKREDAET
jgi:hypothetical protein